MAGGDIGQESNVFALRPVERLHRTGYGAWGVVGVATIQPGRVVLGFQIYSEMKPWGVETAFSAARSGAPAPPIPVAAIW